MQQKKSNSINHSYHNTESNNRSFSTKMDPTPNNNLNHSHHHHPNNLNNSSNNILLRRKPLHSNTNKRLQQHSRKNHHKKNTNSSSNNNNRHHHHQQDNNNNSTSNNYNPQSQSQSQTSTHNHSNDNSAQMARSITALQSQELILQKKQSFTSFMINNHDNKKQFQNISLIAEKHQQLQPQHDSIDSISQIVFRIGEESFMEYSENDEKGDRNGYEEGKLNQHNILEEVGEQDVFRDLSLDQEEDDHIVDWSHLKVQYQGLFDNQHNEEIQQSHLQKKEILQEAYGFMQDETLGKELKRMYREKFKQFKELPHIEKILARNRSWTKGDHDNSNQQEEQEQSNENIESIKEKCRKTLEEINRLKEQVKRGKNISEKLILLQNQSQSFQADQRTNQSKLDKLNSDESKQNYLNLPKKHISNKLLKKASLAESSSIQNSHILKGHQSLVAQLSNNSLSNQNSDPNENSTHRTNPRDRSSSSCSPTHQIPNSRNKLTLKPIIDDEISSPVLSKLQSEEQQKLYHQISDEPHTKPIENAQNIHLNNNHDSLNQNSNDQHPTIDKSFIPQQQDPSDHLMVEDQGQDEFQGQQNTQTQKSFINYMENQSKNNISKIITVSRHKRGALNKSIEQQNEDDDEPNKQKDDQEEIVAMLENGLRGQNTHGSLSKDNILIVQEGDEDENEDERNRQGNQHQNLTNDQNENQQQNQEQDQNQHLSSEHEKLDIGNHRKINLSIIKVKDERQKVDSHILKGLETEGIDSFCDVENTLNILLERRQTWIRAKKDKSAQWKETQMQFLHKMKNVLKNPFFQSE